MRMINWNIERRKPTSWQAISLLAEIQSLTPDIVCLTEAHEHSAVPLGGHSATTSGTAWSQQLTSERKVLIWTHSEWRNIDKPQALNSLGAAISGETEIAGQTVRIIGVCIPYHMASPLGLHPKRAPWEQHRLFVAAFREYLASIDPNIPTLILGDFNRKIPRRGGPLATYNELIAALNGYHILTEGLTDETGQSTVDHICMNAPALQTKLSARSRFDERGKPRSDHFGVVADLALN